MLIIMFNSIFFLGYLFRLVNFGWLMFILAIPEYLFRSFYYMAGLYVLKKSIEKNKVTPSILLQLLYVFTSFSSYDGSDSNTYTFAHLWINPPGFFIITLWILLAATTIILLIISFITYLKQPTKFHVTPLWLFSHMTLGCFLIPALSVSLLLLLSQSILISHLF